MLRQCSCVIPLALFQTLFMWCSIQHTSENQTCKSISSARRYNPCTPIKNCISLIVGDAAICKQSILGIRFGQQSLAKFVSGDIPESITIEYPDRAGRSISLVNLECDYYEPHGRLEYVWSNETWVKLRLHTRRACSPLSPTQVTPRTTTASTTRTTFRTTTRITTPTRSTSAKSTIITYSDIGTTTRSPIVIIAISGAVILVAFGIIGGCVACCCSKNANEVSPEPTNEIINANNNSSSPTYTNGRGLHSTAESWESETHYQSSQTQRMPEVFVPNVAGAYQLMGTANFPSAESFSTSARTTGGERATQDLAPPSYDAVIQMREIEIRQSY